MIQRILEAITLVARGFRIFRLIPARIYFTRGEENLWWHHSGPISERPIYFEYLTVIIF
jgi:hypothetical protein